METIFEIILEDDNTPYGGTLYSIETLDHFIESSGLSFDVDTIDTFSDSLNHTAIKTINEGLKECGILPIPEEKLDDALRNTKILKNSNWFYTEDFCVKVGVPFTGLLDLHGLQQDSYTQSVGISEGDYYLQEDGNYLDIIHKYTGRTVLCDGEVAHFVFDKDENGRAWFMAHVFEENNEGDLHIHHVKFTPNQFLLAVVRNSLQEFGGKES